MAGGKKKNTPVGGGVPTEPRKLIADYRALTHRIMNFAHRGALRFEFLREVATILLDYSGCDAVEIRTARKHNYYTCEVVAGDGASYRCEVIACAVSKEGRIFPCSRADSSLEKVCRCVAGLEKGGDNSYFSANGGFSIGDTTKPFICPDPWDMGAPDEKLTIGGEYLSLAIIPILLEDRVDGLLQFKSRRKGFFGVADIDFYESIARTLGVAGAHRHAQISLRERIKELTCLYGIARIVVRPDAELDDVLRDIVILLPPAWLYPETASALIELDGRSYATAGHENAVSRQTGDITVNGECRGRVEVGYSEEKPELDEGPFLNEERSLILAIARELAVMVERREAEKERRELQLQLRHADRLATIGQLAAGVAHELNEPLGAILGFAQLARKYPDLPESVANDIDKIVDGSLHAREIVRNLMLFARQKPPQKISVDLNRIVEDSLFIVKSRCAKSGVKLVQSLSPDLPEITADPAQMNQVVVNLAVNSLQAMPDGGKLTLSTRAEGGYVYLAVEDTGAGMSREIRERVFEPFFTTKKVREGTGLGLSLAHGIVTTHGGTIRVESESGVGTLFEIRLPASGVSSAREDAK